MGTKTTSLTSHKRHRQNQSGFTIIEVTLFLAISGALAALLLGGWTTMINTQRYKDSITTLQSFVQQQYNLTYNVENGRSNTLVCNSASEVTETTGPATLLIGQSDCVVMGRFIHIVDGQVLTVSSIVGNEPSSTAGGANVKNISDYESIETYEPKRVAEASGLSDGELSVPWGAAIVTGKGNTTKRNYSIAIVRAPLSGIVHTFFWPSDTPDATTLPDVKEMAVPVNEVPINLCLDAGNPLSGGNRGVVILKGASSQNAIQTSEDGDGTC